MNRRQFMQAAGLAAVASVASPRLAGAAETPTYYELGNSVGAGYPLCNRPPYLQDVWSTQVARNLAVSNVNAAIAATVLPQTILTQAAYPERKAWPCIIWAGHADIDRGLADQVIPNLRTLVKWCEGPVLVLGVTNGHDVTGRDSAYFETMRDINAQIMDTFPALDMQRLFLTDGLQAGGITDPTPADVEYLMQGRVPDSLLAEKSRVHHNTAGQTAAAIWVTEWVRAAGWPAGLC